jgi:enoyl-CoA hydratase/carnithine racemase
LAEPSFITVTRDGAIATVALNRPDRRNAITSAMLADLEQVAKAFADDEQIRAVIFRGEGSHFSVGADLAQPPSRPAEPASLVMRRRAAELGGRAIRAIQEIPQPTVCALQGVATGGGACIATACDFRVAAEGARVGYGEVRMGMNLMWNALPLCVHLVGPARAKQMVMSGRLIDAETLERWGFVDAVVAPAALAEAARQAAEEYAALPPVAVQMIKRSINRIAGALDAAVMHMDADQFLLAAGSADYQEAVAAFFAKRKPTFTGD